MVKHSALAWGIALIAGIVAVYQTHQLQLERKLTAQLRTQGPQIPGSAASSSGTATAPGDTSVQPVTAGIATSATASVPALPLTPAQTESVRAGFVRPSATEVEKVGSSYKLNQLRQRYPGLVKELHLTPAEAEAFQDLLAKQDAAFNSMSREVIRLDPLTLRQMSQDMRKAQAAELEAQLGPARSTAWQEYQTTVDARQRVNELTMMLAATSPITEAQSGPLLANILSEQRRRAAEESQRKPPGDDPRALLEFEERNLQSRVESNRRTVETARSFMNAEQVSLMQDSMDRFNERTRASLQTRRQRLELAKQP